MIDTIETIIAIYLSIGLVLAVLPVILFKTYREEMLRSSVFQVLSVNLMVMVFWPLFLGTIKKDNHD